MTFVVKDANTQLQSVATEPTGAGELAFVRVAAFDVAGVATLVNSGNPLPVAPVGNAAAVSNRQLGRYNHQLRLEFVYYLKLLIVELVYVCCEEYNSFREPPYLV